MLSSSRFIVWIFLVVLSTFVFGFAFGHSYFSGLVKPIFIHSGDNNSSRDVISSPIPSDSLYSNKFIESEFDRCMSNNPTAFVMKLCYDTAFKDYDAELKIAYSLLSSAYVDNKIEEEGLPGENKKLFDMHRREMCRIGSGFARGSSIEETLYSECYLRMTRFQIQNVCSFGIKDSVCMIDPIPQSVLEKYEELEKIYKVSLGARINYCVKDGKVAYVVSGSGGYTGKSFYYAKSGNELGSSYFTDAIDLSKPRPKPPINIQEYTCKTLKESGVFEKL